MFLLWILSKTILTKYVRWGNLSVEQNKKVENRKYGGETQASRSLSRPAPPSVLRVIQNPFGKVIFVKKTPTKATAPPNEKSQRTNNGTFDFSTFIPRNFPEISSTDIFFQNVFWQNSRQEHNLKLNLQGFGITRHIDIKKKRCYVRFLGFWWYRELSSPHRASCTGVVLELY